MSVQEPAQCVQGTDTSTAVEMKQQFLGTHQLISKQANDGTPSTQTWQKERWSEKAPHFYLRIYGYFCEAGTVGRPSSQTTWLKVARKEHQVQVLTVVKVDRNTLLVIAMEAAFKLSSHCASGTALAGSSSTLFKPTTSRLMNKCCPAERTRSNA
eukprot:1153215-Pelagomonas_calceolata.AAC.1